MKMDAVYLKGMEVAPGEICRLCKISRPTLAKYLHTYQAEGIEGLKRWDYGGRNNQLLEHSDSVESYFRKNPPMTSNQAVEEIEKLTGIRRSPTQVRAFMRSIGMRFRKMGFVPKGVEEEVKQQEQEEFCKKNSSPYCGRQKTGNGWHFS